MSSKPIHVIKTTVKGLTAAVFKNPGGYGIQIRKRFFRDGNWIDARAYFPNELETLADLAREARDWCDANPIEDAPDPEDGFDADKYTY